MTLLSILREPTQNLFPDPILFWGGKEGPASPPQRQASLSLGSWCHMPGHSPPCGCHRRPPPGSPFAAILLSMLITVICCCPVTRVLAVTVQHSVRAAVPLCTPLHVRSVACLAVLPMPALGHNSVSSRGYMASQPLPPRVPGQARATVTIQGHLALYPCVTIALKSICYTCCLSFLCAVVQAHLDTLGCGQVGLAMRGSP